MGKFDYEEKPRSPFVITGKKPINPFYNVESESNGPDRFAILKIESKGSNLYRLEGCTNDMVPTLVSEAVAKYVDEMKNLLAKANEILEKAKKDGIKLEFNINLDQKGL